MPSASVQHDNTDSPLRRGESGSALRSSVAGAAALEIPNFFNRRNSSSTIASKRDEGYPAAAEGFGAKFHNKSQLAASPAPDETPRYHIDDVDVLVWHVPVDTTQLQDADALFRVPPTVRTSSALVTVTSSCAVIYCYERGVALETLQSKHIAHVSELGARGGIVVSSNANCLDAVPSNPFDIASHGAMASSAAWDFAKQRFCSWTAVVLRPKDVRAARELKLGLAALRVAPRSEPYLQRALQGGERQRLLATYRRAPGDPAEPVASVKASRENDGDSDDSDDGKASTGSSAQDDARRPSPSHYQRTPQQRRSRQELRSKMEKTPLTTEIEQALVLQDEARTFIAALTPTITPRRSQTPTTPPPTASRTHERHHRTPSKVERSSSDQDFRSTPFHKPEARERVHQSRHVDRRHHYPAAMSSDSDSPAAPFAFTAAGSFMPPAVPCPVCARAGVRTDNMSSPQLRRHVDLEHPSTLTSFVRTNATAPVPHIDFSHGATIVPDLGSPSDVTMTITPPPSLQPRAALTSDSKDGTSTVGASVTLRRARDLAEEARTRRLGTGEIPRPAAVPVAVELGDAIPSHVNRYSYVTPVPQFSTSLSSQSFHAPLSSAASTEKTQPRNSSRSPHRRSHSAASSSGERIVCKWCNKRAPPEHERKCSRRNIRCKRCGVTMGIKQARSHQCQ
jgi:hypothetical protein